MASDLLTVTEVREHVETGLPDDALERVVDSEDAYMRAQVGIHDPAGDMTYTDDNPGRRISLPRPASAITSVTRDSWYGFSYEIPARNYRLQDEGRAVWIYDYWTSERYDQMTIVFTPLPENAERTKALIELIRLAIQDTGLSMERDDTYQYAAKPMSKTRRQIIAPLRHNHGGFGVLA